MPDPFSIGTAAIGAGFEIYGGLEAAGIQKQMAATQSAMIGFEQQQNQVRRQAMEMGAYREQLQQVRNAQAARSMALSTGVSQGGQFSSGLQGAFASISGQANTNIGGISQGLQFGERMFDIDQNLSAAKMTYAQEQGKLAQAKGIQDIGSGIMGASKFL